MSVINYYCNDLIKLKKTHENPGLYSDISLNMKLSNGFRNSQF